MNRHAQFWDQYGNEVNADGTSSSGASQTPWTSDINAATFKLTNISEIDFDVSGPMGMSIVDSAPLRTLVFNNADASFHTYFSVVGDHSKNGGFYLTDIATAAAHGACGFIRPAGSYDLGIEVAGSGPVWNCAAGSGNMSFTSAQQFFGSTGDDGSGAQVEIVADITSGKPALSVQGSPVYIGPLSDDGSGASLQVASSGGASGDISTAGSYWAQGFQGITITDAAGTFVGGMRIA